jgi:hypothetical protein
MNFRWRADGRSPSNAAYAPRTSGGSGLCSLNGIFSNRCSAVPYLVPNQYGGSQAYANYVFGVYMACAGYSLSATLTAANAYGHGFRKYPSPNPMDPNYTHIPASNVQNISQGLTMQEMEIYATRISGLSN